MINLEEKKKELLNLLKTENAFLSSEKLSDCINEINQTKIPDSKTEEWKSTDLKRIFKHGFVLGKKKPVPDEFVETFSFYGLNADRLVFVNGYFIQEKSKISQSTNDIFIGSLKDAKGKYKKLIQDKYCSTNLQKNNFFAAINSVYAQDGAFIYIPDNVVIENPIHLVNFIHGDNQKVFSQTRNLIITGTHTKVKIISSYHSFSEDFTLNNVVTEIICGENSSTEFYMFEGEGNFASHINNTFINQNTNSIFKSNTASLCGTLVRNEIHVDFLGENCETDLKGVYFPDKEQHFDNYINIKHSKPNCKSNQLYKGIIDNKAKSVFTGKVFVAPDAQKTDATQSNKNLLLTDNATAHSRPQLEIYADDVSCAHGSTIGQLDKEALFYMQTRGIPEKKAKILLMSAFTADVLDDISVKPYQDFVSYLVNKRLKGQKTEGLCSLKICPIC
ncbi:MAG: Fe-S cluster assembly protein SufD [Bacteroidales bacterium]|nr:Fe-S cluster assembly protein SufD [Bacteroidales bacterium]